MNTQITFFNVGGNRQHINYFQELIEEYFPAMLGAHEINLLYGNKKRVRGVASEKEATAITSSSAGDLEHISLHHDDNNALIRYIKAPENFARVVFIASDKHNACPLILIRNKTSSGTATIMWHLSYAYLRQAAINNSSVIRHLPKLLREGLVVDQFESLATALTNPHAEILVTDDELLSRERLGAAGQPKLLDLPEELHIVSSGLEGNIRSYSAIYFQVEDKLIISGDDSCDIPHIWLMESPFSGQAKWQKLTVSELKSFAENLSRTEHVDMRTISLLDVMSAILSAPVEQRAVLSSSSS